MSELRRITVDEVREAADKTGLAIIANSTIGDGCGCPIAVVAIAAGFAGSDEFDSLGDVEIPAKFLGLTDRYATGFLNGFDSGLDSAFGVEARPDGRAGIEDGLACRRAFIEQPRGA